MCYFIMDIEPLKQLIITTFVTKNRCRYDGVMKMRINPFCKFWFVLTLILFPVWIYFGYRGIIDMVNHAKLVRGDIDHDNYAHFTSYEVFGVMLLFFYIFVVEILFVYILYVVMKECNCARLYLVFWDSPFWKFIGLQIVVGIIFFLFTLLIFNDYSHVIIDNMINGNLFGVQE